MPLDENFYKRAERLRITGMGTEHVATWLYSMVRMLRPRRVMEVGLGYTSPFIVQALRDNIDEYRADLEIVEGRVENQERLDVLNRDFYSIPYLPKLYAIDDYSIHDTSAPQVLSILEELDLASLVEVCVGDFRGRSREMSPLSFPLDFVWFDCGGRHEYIDFIEEYWPLINQDHGILLLHFTYWNAPVTVNGKFGRDIILSSIANEIKRQQLAGGMGAGFEVLSLLEPHKSRQGSVTQIRKLAWNSRCRPVDFQDEINSLFGESCKPIPGL